MSHATRVLSTIPLISAALLCAAPVLAAFVSGSTNPGCFQRGSASPSTGSVLIGNNDKHVYELVRTISGVLQQDDLNALAGSAPVIGIGDPRGYLRSDDVRAAVYTTSGAHVGELSFVNGAWQYNDLSAAAGAPTPAVGSPFPYLRSDGTNAVVYRGNDGQVYELHYTTQWNWGNLTAIAGAPAAAYGDPIGYARSDGINAVVYRGSDGNVYELYLQDNWHWGNLTGLAGAPIANGDPVPYVRGDNINAVVYRSGADIYELRLENGSWLAGNLSLSTGAPAAEDNPSPFVGYYGGRGAVVYRGGGHIYELVLWSFWTVVDLTAGTGAPYTAPAPLGQPLAFSGPSGDFVTYVDEGRAVDQLNGVEDQWIWWKLAP